MSGNTIIYSGWTPITCLSTSGLGGNILIRDNHIIETREAAIAIKGCEDVRILSNKFASSAPPVQGAWIVAQDAKAIRTSGNTHTSEVPLMKAAAPAK